METNYILPIEGVSDHMTDEARERLLNWRLRAAELAAANRERVYLNGPDVRQVALTFDDGPDEWITPMIADTLTGHGIKGSFFFVGSKVEQYPDIVRRIYEAGHLVLGHSYAHDRLTTLTDTELADNFNRTQAAIRCVIGAEPAMFRPPFGDADERVVRAADRAGCAIILWSLDTLDWSQKEADHIRRNVDTFARSGEIVLMHSGPGCFETAKALPEIIRDLQRRRLEIVSLGELLPIPAYLG